MHSTFVRGRRFLAVSAYVALAVACHGASPVSEPTPTPFNVVRIEVPKTPTLTFDLARDALGAILEATPENTRWLPSAAVLGTRYMRKRSGPVITDILIIAAVGRQMTDTSTLHPKTLVEVSAWTIESAVARNAFGASAGATQPVVPRPRPLSPSDSTGWANVDRVVEYLVASGAKRVP